MLVEWLACRAFHPEGRWFEPGLCRGVVSLDKNFAPPCLSPPRCINGYRRHNAGGGGGNLVMD